MIPVSRLRAWLLVALVAGCKGDQVTTASGPGDFKLRFSVTNELLAPVTIAIDDTFALILLNGQTSGLAVSPTAQWLTWTSAKPTDANGTPIPDDIGQVKVRVSGIRSVLEITNVIEDTKYVTADLFNQTSAHVSIGVYDGSTVSCASVLRGKSGTVNGFTKIGYYRLLAATEVRAYRDASCAGPYLSWPKSQLAGFSPKSGLVTLTLSAAP
jgi:hypothetical protein